MDRDDNSVENTVKPPSSWPSAGKIEFRSFSMKYHRDLEYALKNINFTINPGEKIGIRKLIVLDEATADVDLETDREMQKLFRSEFKDCTVLTIAHRLETIMGSDRIIAMDNGTVVEFGPPKELIEKGGYFAELVKASGF
ncbi:Multidrug resistance-associated protein 1 [Coemansia sp. RSA 1843]|nr:Multidrug resistance-associated protein 1 [Coemansia sp. RSA 1843]